MYVRPETLYKRMTAYPPAESTLTARGRVKQTASAEGEPIRCVLAETKADEAVMFHQQGLHVTHVLVQKGRRIADTGWEIEADDGKRYRVVSADEPARIGAYTLYYCEEMNV